MWFRLKITFIYTFLSYRTYIVFSTSSNMLFPLILLIFIPLIECNQEVRVDQNTSFSLSNVLRTVRRSVVSAAKCTTKDDCEAILPGSLCLNETCECPQGYLPSSEGKIGCFQTGRHFGQPCNITMQCGDDLQCVNNMCFCPQDFQFFQAHGANLCLLWHKPTRLDERCRNIEDCIHLDPNYACRKRWCQCNNGFQLLETMLFGLKHRCFKTYRRNCHNSSQCTKLAEATDQHCVCVFGFCHCIPNSNASDIYGWVNERPTWYQRWKKDLILATRLLFITIILFFVPCFVYVTLGVRERSRLLFSQVVQPSRNAGIQVQYSRGRNSIPHVHSNRGHPPSNAETHSVEIALGSRGINSRLVNNNPRSTPAVHGGDAQTSEPRRARGESEARHKDEDPPPSYEEIMRIERVRDVPPPPYQDL